MLNANSTRSFAVFVLMAAIVASFLCSCQSAEPYRIASAQPASAQMPGMTRLALFAPAKALVEVPVGWTADPLKSNSRHVHETWLSPSHNTAYGVILMYLPWPAGPDLTLWGFMNHLRESEGSARLLSKQWDDKLPGYRFVAEGGIYKIRVNLIVRGNAAWAVYAGTRLDHPVAKNELEVAERARDDTRVGYIEAAEKAAVAQRQ